MTTENKMTAADYRKQHQAKLAEKQAKAWYAKHEKQAAVISQCVKLIDCISAMLDIPAPECWSVEGRQIFATFDGYDAVGAVKMRNGLVPFTLKKVFGEKTGKKHEKGYDEYVMPWDDESDWEYSEKLDDLYTERFLDAFFAAE